VIIRSAARLKIRLLPGSTIEYGPSTNRKVIIVTNVLKKSALLLACLLLPSAVFAQATRTWVSGVGDDANPCSRTAPCKTWAGAISKTATNGEIDALDPGGFGAVTITKAITIDGGCQIAGVLVSGTNGIVVQAASTDAVIIRNLDINGVGTGLNGIRLLSGAALHVENVVIYGFTSRGIDVAPTATASVMIKNTLLRENNIGIALLPSAGSVYATLDGVSSNHNSAHGIYVGNNSHAMIRNSTFDSNGSVGVYVEQTTGSSEASLDECVIFGSSYGIYAGSGASVTRISRVTVTGNATGISFSGGTVVSYGNNHISGNAGGNGPASSNIGQQ
jgi:hypothetical protein